LVERRTAPGSEYDRAKKKALASYRGYPQKLSGSKLAIDNLRAGKASNANPHFLSAVIEERNALERILEEGVLNFTQAADDAFRQWLNECRNIQRDAEPLEVDGCWYLYHVYEAAQPSPSDAAKCAKAMVGSRNLGGGTLQWILSAADSVVAWIEENPAAPPMAIKPKRSTERGEGQAKLAAALTKHHKYADSSCLNLEPIGNNQLARLAEVSDSTASAFFRKEFEGHKKYRAVCGDTTRLVAALKLLNQEYSPHHLYGGSPPGGDEWNNE
jgi:hypothetical protein